MLSMPQSFPIPQTIFDMLSEPLRLFQVGLLVGESYESLRKLEQRVSKQKWSLFKDKGTDRRNCNMAAAVYVFHVTCRITEASKIRATCFVINKGEGRLDICV